MTLNQLPAPLDGSVNEIVEVGANSQGTTAVVADVNRNAATGVISFSTKAPAHRRRDASDGADLVVNAANDVLYWTTAIMSVHQAEVGGSQTIGAARRRSAAHQTVARDGPAAVWMVDKPALVAQSLPR